MPSLHALQSRPQLSYFPEGSERFTAVTPDASPAGTSGAGPVNMAASHEPALRSRYQPRAFASVEELVARDIEAFSQRRARVS